MFSLLSFTVKSLCNSKYTQKRLNTLRIHFSFSKIICKVWLSPSSCLTFSPVIKVGNAEDANVNTHTAASDSDEEFQLHASVSSKRIKSNLFWSNDKVSKRPVFKTFPANIFVSGKKKIMLHWLQITFFSWNMSVQVSGLFRQISEVVQPYVVIIDFKYKMYYT